MARMRRRQAAYDPEQMAPETLFSDDRLLTYEQAGAHLAVSRDVVRSLVLQGILPYIEVTAAGQVRNRAGKPPNKQAHLRVRYSDLKEYVRKQLRRVNRWDEHAEIWPRGVACRMLNISLAKYAVLREEGLLVRCSPEEIRHAIEVLYHRRVVKVLRAEAITSLKMRNPCPVCRHQKGHPGAKKT